MTKMKVGRAEVEPRPHQDTKIVASILSTLQAAPLPYLQVNVTIYQFTYY